MSTKSNPWAWVSTLYFAEGFPYILVNVVSVIMFKRLDVSNAEIGLYTSWLYLPWVIKPLWSPLLELKSDKRQWFLGMQFLGSVSFLMLAIFLRMDAFFILSLIALWLAAIWSATHDIAADGYYMIALTEKQQSFFIGIRSTFYRIAMIGGQGGIVILAGVFEEQIGNNQIAWSWAMVVVSVIMLLVFLANWQLTPKVDELKNQFEGLKGFKEVFLSFFQKKHIVASLAFILTYRLGESQLVKMASPFLLDENQQGGLALNTKSVGMIYGTLGWIALSIGGILGGYLISRHGLGKWIWPMAIALNLPNLLYVGLSMFQNVSVEWVALVVIVEQFGYGFGFTSFLLFTIYLAEGSSKTAHYAIATGFMALGMMLPGMISGFVQEYLGYNGFFIWVVIAGLPGIYLIRHLHYPKEFGLKTVANA